MGGGDNVITISANLATEGFKKGSQQLEKAIRGLTASSKRLAGSVVGVASVYGILSKAINSFMSENQKLSAQMNSIWTALGNVLGPIITQIISWVTTAVSYFLEFLRLLGLTAKTASQLSKSAKGAGGDLKKTIAGFDELNLLNGPGGGGGANATLEDVTPEEWMKKLAELLKNKMWDEAADIIVEKMNNLINVFVEKAREFGEKVGEYLGGIIHIIARVIRDVDWNGVGEGIAEFFNGLFENIDGKDVGTILVGKIKIALQVVAGFLETFDFAAFAKWVSDVVVGAMETLGGAIEKIDFKKIGANIRAFFENIDWVGIANAIFEGLKAAWNAALDLLRGFLKKDGEEEDPPIVKSLERLGEAVSKFCEDVSPMMEAILNNVLKPLGEWLMNSGIPAAIDLIADAFGVLGEAMSGFWDLINGRISLREYFNLIKDSITGTGEASDMAGEKLPPVSNGFDNVAGSANDASEALGDAAEAMNEYGEAVDKASGPSEHSRTSYARTTEVLKQQAGAASADAEQIKNLVNSQTNATETFNHLADAVGEVNENVENVGKATDESTGVMSSAVSTLQSAISDRLGRIKTDANNSANSMSREIQKSMGETRGAVINTADAISSGTSRIVGAFSGMGSAISGELGYVSNNAYYWGQDMMYNLSAGINSRTGFVMASVGNLAWMIHQYLGFSEPEKGPLSDFHTYGPDMMELYASGINSAKSDVFAAVNSVAEGVADGLGNVDVPMSAVASGGVTPYGIGGTGIGGDDLVTKISSAVYEAVVSAMGEQTQSGQRIAVLEVNGREFCRATYYDQQAVAKEHGVSLVTSG